MIEDEILCAFSTDLNNQAVVLAKIIPDHNQRLFYTFVLFMTQRIDLFYPVCVSKYNHSIIAKMQGSIYPKSSIT